MTDLQQAILDACLQLSKDAMAIFDAVESDGLTIDTARGVQTMVVPGVGLVRG